MFRFIAFYVGLFALVCLAILGAAQTRNVPAVAPMSDLTLAAD